MKRFRYVFIAAVFAGICVVPSCEEDDLVVPPDVVDITTTTGFYLLNEGAWGGNNASLDYMDYAEGKYKRNIYADINPEIVKELGDVGNDLQIYGGKLYAIIASSGLVEIMDITTAKHIAEISVPNCRSIVFYNGKGYVSSWGENMENPGYVVEFDTINFQKARQVNVGLQPEEMVVVNQSLYVANSGGMASAYDHTISMIDLNSMVETKKIDVAVNLFRMHADSDGDLYVTSRGNYFDVAPKLYVVSTKTNTVQTSFDLAVENFCISGDTAYIFGVTYAADYTPTVSYNMINVKTETLLSQSFITDETEASIDMPYGITVDPISKDIYLTDAKDYSSSGAVYCFDKHGKKLWETATGIIPSHIAFVTQTTSTEQ